MNTDKGLFPLSKLAKPGESWIDNYIYINEWDVITLNDVDK